LLFKFADILGSDAKYKLFCLILMHKVRKQRSGEVKKYLTNFRKD